MDGVNIKTTSGRRGAWRADPVAIPRSRGWLGLIPLWAGRLVRVGPLAVEHPRRGEGTFRGVIAGCSAELHFCSRDLADNRRDGRVRRERLAPTATRCFPGPLGPASREAVAECFPAPGVTTP